MQTSRRWKRVVVRRTRHVIRVFSRERRQRRLRRSFDTVNGTVLSSVLARPEKAAARERFRTKAETPTLGKRRGEVQRGEKTGNEKRGERRDGALFCLRGDTFRQGRNSPSSSLYPSPLPSRPWPVSTYIFVAPRVRPWKRGEEHRFAGVLRVKTRYRIGCTFATAATARVLRSRFSIHPSFREADSIGERVSSTCVGIFLRCRGFLSTPAAPTPLDRLSGSG